MEPVNKKKRPAWPMAVLSEPRHVAAHGALLMAWKASRDGLLLTPRDVGACSGGPQCRRTHHLGPSPLSGLQK